MATSSSQRSVHQDYIARIRYSNTLPPPPNPPKLLDIPNTGLASGQYTNPGFASRLARDQPLNIEADAELGMPLDLVGMPGIFDGDESSIQAPLQAPVPHPHDRALLRPLSSLGKPKFSDSGVSFLRRTEYISSHTSRSRFESTTSRSLINNTGSRTKRAADGNIDTESPEYIKTRAAQSFTIAANLLKAPREIKHPNRSSKARLLDAYPILPDVAAFPDAGGYCTIKFLTNPVPPSTSYDTRLETSMLKPVPPTEEEDAQKLEAKELHERDPEHFPAPEDTMEYEFFMTETPAESLKFKRKFDPLDPEHDSEDLYPQQNGDGEGCFRFKRIRPYESQSLSGSTYTKYDDDIVIAVHDGSDGLRQKGAYYYPIVQRIAIRPQRNKNIEMKKMQFQPGQNQRNEDSERGVTDFLDLKVEDPDAYMVKERNSFITRPYGPEEGDEQKEGEGEKDGVSEDEGDVGSAKEKNGGEVGETESVDGN